MQRDDSVETLRAIAITLVVAYHITGDPPVAAQRTFYELLTYSLQNVRMPLFTAVSGYIYALRPVHAGALGDFVRGKLRRLLVPMVCVATIEYLLIAVAPGIHNPAPLGSIWRIYVLPYQHYWFLQAVFLVFLIVGTLDSRGYLQAPPHFGLAFAVSVLCFVTFPLAGVRVDVFSLGGCSYLLPFFLVGLGTRRFQTGVASIRGVRSAAVVFVVGFGLQQANWIFGGELLDSSRRSLVGLAVGASICMILLRDGPRNRALAWVGGHAYTIYLFQAFGAGLGRRVLGVPGIHPHLYVVGVLAIALAVGIALDETVSRVPYLRVLLLGKRKAIPAV